MTCALYCAQTISTLTACFNSPLPVRSLALLFSLALSGAISLLHGGLRVRVRDLLLCLRLRSVLALTLCLPRWLWRALGPVVRPAIGTLPRLRFASAIDPAIASFICSGRPVDIFWHVAAFRSRAHQTRTMARRVQPPMGWLALSMVFELCPSSNCLSCTQPVRQLPSPLWTRRSSSPSRWGLSPC